MLEKIYDSFRRLTDVTSAFALIVLLSPLFLVIAAAIRISSKGPIIFRQKRLTHRGRHFTLFKFRTMTIDHHRSNPGSWTVPSDPRITSVGRFLRRYRLDELPQLLNVLIGDMTLIGPRPECPDISLELARSLPEFRKRLEVKAGITGLAQVTVGYAASIESYQCKLDWDLHYVRNRSFCLDTLIALRTVLVVVTGFGAR